MNSDRLTIYSQFIYKLKYNFFIKFKPIKLKIKVKIKLFENVIVKQLLCFSNSIISHI